MVSGSRFTAGHCVKARRMSLTSMVPITIFSQLTISWAVPSSLLATVTNTRLLLVTVLPENLWTGSSGGRTGGLRSKQQRLEAKTKP